jgi:hypothetical protein
MTSFSHIFRSTRDLAISQGRRPVVCLLGPDMQAGFTDYCGDLSPFMKKMAKDDPWLKTVKPGDLGTLQGIRLRKMESNGLAMLTAPAPESGFDTTN